MKLNFPILTFAAVLAAGTVWTAPSWADTSPLAERHASKGIKCEMCHGSAKPDPLSEVPRSACLKCHEEKALIARNASLGDRNPHKNHLGEVDCWICHKGHETSSVYCEQCHKNFKLKIR